MASGSKRLNKIRRHERASHPIVRQSRLEYSTHGSILSNYNSNVNSVYGPVHSIVNSSPVSNYVVYGAIPEETDSIQIKISADLKTRHVPQAVYDAQLGSGCMEGTRVQILRDIENWIKDPKAQQIFWLTGLAGTGKTAIAWTVCSRASNDPEIILGGSFFCSRSASWAAQRDVRCVIPTLAQLLARQSGTFSQALADELAHDPDVLHKQVPVQIEKLLVRPLQVLALADSRVPVVFVIDALDECGGESTAIGTSDDAESHRIVSEMLEALVASSRTELRLPVKFLVTSRPETHIRDTPVSDVEFSKVLRLHTVNKEQVTADIRLYIATKLLSATKLRAIFTDEDADMLARLCDGLFIVAATALQYALGAGIDRAAMKFKTLFNTSRNGLSTGAAAPLDRMYALVLEDAARIDEPETDELPTMLQLLAALLSVRMMLSVTALAELLNMQKGDVRASLSRLHAVVHVPEDDGEPGLRTLHASFGDYLSSRAPRHIRIPESLGHDISVRACLRVIAERLYFNVSQSSSSYLPNASTKPDDITLSLEYACTQWVYHLAYLPEPSALDNMIDDIFRRQFMFWLEVMSILGQVQRAALMLIFAAETVQLSELSRFFRDANFFVVSSHQAIERGAPHIYLSALPLADKDGLIYNTFAPRYTGLISVDLFDVKPHGERLIMTLTGHERGATSVAYSPNGLLIVSSSGDGAVRIWSALTGEEMMSPLRGGDTNVLSVAIAPDGKSVASGTEAGSICVWSILGGQSTRPRRLYGHSQGVTSLAFSPDSSLLASGSQDTTVRVWRIGTDMLLAVSGGQKGSVDAVTFISDREIKVSDGSDWTSLQLRGLGAKPPHRFSLTGRSMVWVGGRSVFLWTQRDVGEWSRISLDGHTGTVRSAIFSPDGLYIASASDDGIVRIWDAGVDHTVVQPLPAARSTRNRMGISLNGTNIVSVSGGSSTSVWNAQAGMTNISPLLGHNGEILFVTISSDGRFIASASKDGTVQLWDAQTGVAVGGPLTGHLSGVRVVAFTLDAQWLASGSDDHDVRIWDVTRGRAANIRPLQCNSAVRAITFSPDGELVAAGDWMGVIQLWQIETNQPMPHKSIQGHTSTVHSIAFSADGVHIVSGGHDAVCRVWKVSTGYMVFELIGHASAVRSVAYSPDSRFIATGSDDKVVRLWDAENGMSIATFHGHREPVVSVGFTFDAESIVSGSDDETISVWDMTITRLAGFQRKGGDDIAVLAAAAIKGGWLTGPSGELLLWVPVEYHSYLQIPPCKARIDRSRVVITVGGEGWHRGDTWISCWRTDLPNVVFDNM